MAAPPALPVTPNWDVESVLSRKYGREVTNYFSGSTINRVSFLRENTKFLAEVVKQADFVLFKDLAPLTKDSGTNLVYQSFEEVTSLITETPFAKTENDLIATYDPTSPIPMLLFLGLDEASPDPKPFFHSGRYSGQPIFALDVTLPPESGALHPATKSLVDRLSSVAGHAWSADRMFLSLPATQAALYAQARHLLDWHVRNPFCASCGSRTLAIHAGWKRTCPPSHLAGGAVVTNPPCRSRTGGVSNLSFPRTDAVIICAVVSADSQRILLGRQPRYPRGVYSTLAGFLEPGESVAEAVRREVWEEAGVRVGRVVVHSSQPWPYPANLMIGCIATALPDGEVVDLGNDQELQDARWWGVDDVRGALARAGRVRGMGASDGTPQESVEGLLWVPPRTAIANALMEAVCNQGFLGGGDENVM